MSLPAEIPPLLRPVKIPAISSTRVSFLPAKRVLSGLGDPRGTHHPTRTLFLHLLRMLRLIALTLTSVPRPRALGSPMSPVSPGDKAGHTRQAFRVALIYLGQGKQCTGKPSYQIPAMWLARWILHVEGAGLTLLGVYTARPPSWKPGGC